jgi:hypothetical protein
MISRAPKGRSKNSVECEIMESAAVASQPFGLDAYGQLTDRLGRAFQRLGLKRVMHDVTPDLGAHLAATAAGKSQDDLGAVAAPAIRSYWPPPHKI